MLSAYQPTKNSNVFEYRVISCWQQHSNSSMVSNKALKLSLNNTCRHTGIDFLNSILGGSVSEHSPHLSSHFFLPFSCVTTMASGRYKVPLYLLPMPPSAYVCDKSKKAALSTLYFRMERLLQSHVSSQSTRLKFNVLKTLYAELIIEQKLQANDKDFFEIILSHYSCNQQIIDKHRGWHWPFFHSPKTQQMFETFESHYKLMARSQ